jgi:FPC/CPF motif-containing protein YcgG
MPGAADGWRAAWFAPALEWLEEVVSCGDFPCYFGVNAWKAGTLAATEIAENEIARFVVDLRQFIVAHASLPYRSALIAYWRGTSLGLSGDEHSFWGLVNAIARQSHTQACRRFDDPDWQFIFDDEALFLTGHSPYFKHRLSRLSRPFPMMVIQTYRNLRQVGDAFPTPASVANRIRASVDRYDRIRRAPVIEQHVPDWRSFWLLDHNDSDGRSCPLIF